MNPVEKAPLRIFIWIIFGVLSGVLLAMGILAFYGLKEIERHSKVEQAFVLQEMVFVNQLSHNRGLMQAELFQCLVEPDPEEIRNRILGIEKIQRENALVISEYDKILDAGKERQLFEEVIRQGNDFFGKTLSAAGTSLSAPSQKKSMVIADQALSFRAYIEAIGAFTNYAEIEGKQLAASTERTISQSRLVANFVIALALLTALAAGFAVASVIRRLDLDKLVLLQEVQERKRTGEELRTKTAFLEALVNSSIDGILVVNQDGHKILQNERLNDLFKIPPEIAQNPVDDEQRRWVAGTVRKPEEFLRRIERLNSAPDEISRDEIEFKSGMFLDRYSCPVMGINKKYYGRLWTFRDVTGQKLDQQALRENEERFAGAFEYAPIGVALVSPEGCWLKVNRALCAMLDYSESELLRKSFQDVTHPDDLISCLDHVRRLIDGEIKTCQSEKRYIHKDGHPVPVAFSLSVVRDDEGKPRYLIAQIQDITERKLAGDKLAANEILLRQFVQYTPAAIAMLDNQMRYIQVSDRWIKDYRLEGKNIIGKSHYELFPDVPQRWKDIHKRVLAGAVENCAEDPFPRQDGSIDWLQWEARPWRKAGGETGGLIFFTQVITERKREEEQIRFNEQRYRSLVEATTAIVWDTPASGEFEVEQPAWSAFTGQKFEELKGWGWLNAIHSEDQTETARVWSLAVANRTAYEVEHRLRSADGNYHDMMVRGVPILGEKGEIRQWIGIHIDISDRKRAELALRDRTQLAELTAEARSAWTKNESLSKTLQVCCEAIVRHLEGAFARIWTLNEKEQMLELQASAGMYTHLDGPHGRVPVGKYKIGLIALERRPHLTNHVVGDSRVSDQEWAAREGMVGFAGYPLIVGGRLIGVVALFARHALSDSILTGLASVADNIALSIERKQSEEWLRLLSSSVEQANESIVITDAELDGPGPRIIFVNPAYTLMTGYTAEEAIGKSPRHLQGPRTDRAVLDRLRGNLERGEVFKGQAINYRKDGTEFTLEWQITPLRNVEGKITHFLAIQRDITERIQKEEHLRLLESAVKQSKESIIITDAQLDAPGPRIVFVNPAFTQMTGYAAEDAVGKSPRILQGPRTDRAVLDRLRQCLEKGETFEGEAINYRQNGTEFDLKWQITPIRDLSKKIINFVALQRDITDRKRIEETSRRQQEELRILFDLMPAMIWFKDTNNGILRVNQRVANAVGKSVVEIEGKSTEEIYPRDAEKFYAGDLEVIESGLPKLGLVEMRSEKDKKIWIQTDKVPYFDSQGKVIGIVVMAQNVTARKASEAALQKSEERFRSYFELGLIGMAITSPSKGWIEVNDLICHMLGYERSELLKMSWAELTYPDDLAVDLANLNRVLAGEIEGYSLDKRFIRKDGDVIHTTMSAKCLRLEDGTVDYFIVLLQDITARKFAEEELYQSRERLRGILDHIPQRVFWKDRESTFLGCNKAFARDVGFTDSSEVIGKTDYDVWSEELAKLYQSDDQLVIELDKAKFHFEEPGLAADGSSAWLRTSKVPLHDQQGRVTGILGTYEDVTEAKQAKVEIQKLEAHLVQSQKLETVGKLAGGIAHEFNSILTAIIGQSELLLHDLPSTSPLVKGVHEISKAAGRAATLTRQLLAYGRKQLLQPEILDLNRILAGMKDMLQHLMGGEVEILIHGVGVQAVRADAGQIEQVIVNMAMNAREAMPNGGKLTLETDSFSCAEDMVGNYPEIAPGNYVRLTITDTGMGMSEEVKARVFEPFFTTKAVGEGTGLGLSTCYGIIKQSGGHISVYSEYGRGSSFKIYLPEVRQGPVPQVSPPALLHLPRGTETILLVEDDPALREMASVLLRRLGYNVLEAAHGIEALTVRKRAGIGHIDLLFTDVVMPHMSGTELAERVRALFPKTRILFTSAYTGNAMAHQGILDKGVALLQKPFTPSALAVKIREVLDQPVAKDFPPG